MTAPPRRRRAVLAVAGVVIVLVGALGLAAFVSAAMLCTCDPVRRLGPVEEGEYLADFAPVDRERLEEEGLLEGLEEPFDAFVMKYNAQAANDPTLAGDDARWDAVFYERTAASVYQHVRWKRTFRRLDSIKDDYATVTAILHELELPEVFAGIPYRESIYLKDVQSNACARGWWQLSPQVANRAGLAVKQCHFADADAPWEPSPTDLTVPRDAFHSAPYIAASGRCRITRCDVDERTDLDKSTRAALGLLAETLHDREIAASGSAVQMAILAHNTGYDDARFGVARKSNVLPAYRSHLQAAGPEAGPAFYGAMITCADPSDLERPAVANDDIPLTTNAPPSTAYCGSQLRAETQHYAYPIVARHLLAVCYYGQNYDDLEAFADWAKWNSGSHYCTNFAIPRPGDLQ